MTNEKRRVYDYYYRQQFFFRIGHVRLLKASAPLKPHEHRNMAEFVYLEKGSQDYQTKEIRYTVKHGEVFFTHPNELHGTGSLPEEVSALYYLIIDLSLIKKLSIFLSEEEYEALNAFLKESKERVFPASTGLPGALKRLVESFEVRDMHFDTHIRNALSEVLIALSVPFQSKKQSQSLSLDESLRYIQEHPEENIRVKDLSVMDHMSLATYHKYFLETMGIPPAEYMQKKKVEKAKKLLAESDLSVTEIAYRYGFSSSQYFATVFKRFCSVTPTQFRESARQAL